ncbi:MAG TPA: hypothetical protein DCS88_13730 [Alphaproteobacteria bacterium]|nr:hypothetical protein [Alphaproteobacteria bacterium]
MSLFASDRRHIEEMGTEIPLRVNPIISRAAIEKFLRGSPGVPLSPIRVSRGHVREGEGVSAEELDRRTMKILEQW